MRHGGNEGRALEPHETIIVNHRMVSPDFQEALRVPLLQGRFFTDADREGSLPVAIISESLAEKYFPGVDPLGKRIRNLRAGADSPWLTVVGVVGDVREFRDVQKTWYVPYAQILTALVASFGPAYRATKVNPIQALRAE